MVESIKGLRTEEKFLLPICVYTNDALDRLIITSCAKVGKRAIENQAMDRLAHVAARDLLGNRIRELQREQFVNSIVKAMHRAAGI